MNLLKETIKDVTNSGHEPEDIVFIGSERTGHCCTWEQFTKLADVEYDDGFGAQEVATDLIIVFSDGAKMWRHEYDGSECWHYSSPFVKPENELPINRLLVKPGQVGWESLADVQE